MDVDSSAWVDKTGKLCIQEIFETDESRNNYQQ